MNLQKGRRGFGQVVSRSATGLKELLFGHSTQPNLRLFHEQKVLRHCIHICQDDVFG
jgi:hypothetical protein